MPNKYVRDANGVLVPKIPEGGYVDATVIAADVKDATLTNAKFVNSTIQSGKISFFKSTEQTGTGSEQNIAHGLGRTPSLVWVSSSDDNGVTGAITLTEGTHDSTNVKVTATTSAKYKVLAL